MILHYSSNNYSYKLGDSGGYIKHCDKGFYINSEKNPKFFDNFIFTSQLTDYYLITSAKTELVIYRITDKIEKAITIYSTKNDSLTKLFNNIILKFENKFVKVNNDLTIEAVEPDSLGEAKWRYSSKEHVNLNHCDIGIICNIPVLYSISANVFYPYEGNVSTEFFFH